MKTFLILIFLFINSVAYASPECDWAIQVHKDENYRISIRNGRIAQLRNQISEAKRVLEKERIPLREAINHTMSVHGASSSAARESQIAVAQAIVFIKDSIISSRSLRVALELIKRNVQLSSDRRLADQIRDASTRGRMSETTKVRLQQFANAVEIVSISQRDWQVAEKEVIELYLSGRMPLIEGLFQQLNTLNERLSADLSDMSRSQAQDQIKADEAAKIVTDLENKIISNLAEISASDKANADSQALKSRWNPAVHCPRVESQSERMRVY